VSAPTQLNKLRGDGQPSRVQDNVGQVIDPLAKAVGKTPIMGAPPPPWIRPNIEAASNYEQAPSSTAVPLPLLSYHKDALGYVHGRIAVLAKAGGAAANAVVWVMPSGYRPEAFELWTLSDGAGLVWEMAAYPNGNVTMISALAAGDVAIGSFLYLAER
jgi:hypothetical protein